MTICLVFLSKRDDNNTCFQSTISSCVTVTVLDRKELQKDYCYSGRKHLLYLFEI